MVTSLVTVTECSLDDLRDQIRRDSGTLYAVLDACDEPRVPEKVQELGHSRAVSLYRGPAEQDYWAIAPYLVQVDELLLGWIVANLWNAAWGIFAVTPVGLDALRTHFRRFLKTRDPEGKVLYFRYYDPRVLPAFLASCSGSEVTQFFGPVLRYVMQGENGKLLCMEAAISSDKPGRSPDQTGRPSIPLQVSATDPFRIRQEHIQALQPVAVEGFEQRVVTHLKASFPEQMELLGREQAREIARYGLRRAERHGITADREVLLWITLMVLLGSDFDEDMQLPWAQQTLGDPAFADPIDRMDQLYDEAMAYLDGVMGAQNEHLRAALARLDAASLPDVARSFGEELRGGAIGWLRSVWPEKSETVGADRLLQLVDHAVDRAHRYSMPGEDGVALHLGLAFFLGIGADHDPQFPWVASIVCDPAITSGPERVLRLEEAARRYWQHWLS